MWRDWVASVHFDAVWLVVAAIALTGYYLARCVWQWIAYGDIFRMAKLRPWLYRLKGFDVSAHPKPYYVSSTVAGVRIVGRPDMVFQHIFLRYLLIVDFKSRYIKAGREISDYEKSQMILYMGLASGGWIRPRARLLFKNTWVTVGYNQRVFAKLTREYAHDLLCYKSGRLERIPPPIQL